VSTISDATATSRLGLGMAALGRPGYITIGHADDLDRRYDVTAMEARAHEVLDAAWAAGIRYFDAARSYGRAEEFLASWLRARGVAPGDVTVASKWGYAYTAEWRVDAPVHEVKEHSLARLDRQLAESRAILGDQLDLYQIHSATRASGVLDDREVIARLRELKSRGLKIGLTVTGVDQSDTVRRALDLAAGGGRLFDAVQATWNVLERSAGDVLAAAHDAGLRVIVKEGVANGRLTARNREPSFAAKRAVLERIGARYGATIDAVALAVALAQPWADIVLSGAATAAHLTSNVAAASLRLDDESLATLAALAEDSASYWQTRAAMPWN
jgi:aryl-alcohol dehydrogenase-like predicted oxidoreductase